jgi:hypothetical protein
LETDSRKAHLAFQICEADSCFGGGKPGVSDTMAAALWGLDFLFILAESNSAGVNFETGVNHLGFPSWHIPIGVDSTDKYRATPLYYAMLTFTLASRVTRVHLILDNADLNITAYAVRSDHGEIYLTLVNKEANRDADVRATCPGIENASVLRLTGPSLQSVDNVVLGGSAVGSDGKWSPNATEPVRVVDGEIEIGVPAASAAIRGCHEAGSYDMDGVPYLSFSRVFPPLIPLSPVCSS